MKAIRITFKKEDCQIQELPEYIFEQDLEALMDEYIWDRHYLQDNINYIMLSTDKNVAEFFDTENGDKIFIAFIAIDSMPKILFDFEIKEKYNFVI